MFFPLGLALKLRNFPFITWLIIVTCFGYFYSSQQKEINHVYKQIKKIKQSEKIQDAGKKLFVDYCLARNLNLTKSECEEFTPKSKENRKRVPKRKKKKIKNTNEPIDIKKVFDQGLKLISLNSDFQKDLAAKNENVTTLKSYPEYEEHKLTEKEKVLTLYKKHSLLSQDNFSLWAVFKATFSHADFMHLIGNMLVLFIFGRYVEDRLGHLNYLGIYLLGGCLAMGGYALFFMQGDIFIVGASANVSVMMGLFYLLFYEFRMKFWVWYLVFTKTFSLNIKFYFFFLYIATDLIFTFTGTSNVAHGAHALGLIIGILSAKAILSREALPRFFMHPEEYQEWLAIKKATKASEVVSISHKILMHNPYNKTVRAYFFKKLLGGERASERTYTPELYHYLIVQLATLAENAKKEDEIDEFLQILSRFPDRYGINSIFKKLDQKKIITFINHAIDSNQLFIALRLIVVYIEKYPSSKKNHNLMRTLQSIIDNIQDRNRLSLQIESFINKITNIKLKSLLSPLIQGESNA